MNKIIPTKVTIPTKAKTAPNPKKVEGKLGIAGLDPLDVIGLAANIAQIKTITVTTVMTGMITSIKLAARPNFLPDSSDILIPLNAILLV